MSYIFWIATDVHLFEWVYTEYGLLLMLISQAKLDHLDVWKTS